MLLVRQFTNMQLVNALQPLMLQLHLPPTLLCLYMTMDSGAAPIDLPTPKGLPLVLGPRLEDTPPPPTSLPENLNDNADEDTSRTHTDNVNQETDQPASPQTVNQETLPDTQQSPPTRRVPKPPNSPPPKRLLQLRPPVPVPKPLPSRASRVMPSAAPTLERASRVISPVPLATPPPKRIRPT